MQQMLQCAPILEIPASLEDGTVRLSAARRQEGFQPMALLAAPPGNYYYCFPLLQILLLNCYYDYY